MMSRPLPLQPVIDARFCVAQPTELIVREKFFSLTGDGATIKDQTGAVWFKVNPKWLSLREKRTVEDAFGSPAFSLKRKLLSLHSTWELHRGGHYDEASKVCDIKSSMMSTVAPGMTKIFKSVVKIYFKDGDKEVDYIAEGNFLSKKFSIFKVLPGGQTALIAMISKESRFRSVSAFIMQTHFDAQTYFLQLQPGADAAFLTALAIVLDENLRDDKDD